jgi:iron complex transport system ATP-binding protein
MSVVHDLSLARRYGTHAVLMNHGRCVSQGKIGDVLTPENLRSVYDMDVYAWMHEMLEQWK